MIVTVYFLLVTNVLTLMALAVVASLLTRMNREGDTSLRAYLTQCELSNYYLQRLGAAESALKWIEKEHGLDGDLEERL